jgi:hypothetical protein
VNFKFFFTLWEKDCGIKEEKQGKYISVYCPKITEKRQISLGFNSFIHFHDNSKVLFKELSSLIPILFIEQALKTNLPVFQLKCLLFAEIQEGSSVLGMCSACSKSISPICIRSEFCLNCKAAGKLKWNFSFRIICFDESSSVEMRVANIEEFAGMKAEFFAKLNSDQISDLKYNISFEPHLLTVRRNYKKTLKAIYIERIPSLY